MEGLGLDDILVVPSVKVKYLPTIPEWWPLNMDLGIPPKLTISVHVHFWTWMWRQLGFFVFIVLRRRRRHEQVVWIHSKWPSM